MNARSALAAIALVAASSPRGYIGSSGPGDGYPAGPELREKRRAAKHARAEKALAKAQAKRDRKAAARKAALEPKPPKPRKCLHGKPKADCWVCKDHDWRFAP